MSTDQECLSCRRPKADRACGLCSEPVCRGCAQFLEEGSFAYRAEVAQELKHSFYCQGCYSQTVEPELEQYQETLERARDVFFFFNTQKRPVQLMNKGTSQAVVSDCEDRDETILRMGFIAAEQGFNAIVDAEVNHEKVRNHGWHKTRWSGRGWPAQVDAEKLSRHDY